MNTEALAAYLYNTLGHYSLRWPMVCPETRNRWMQIAEQSRLVLKGAA